MFARTGISKNPVKVAPAVSSWRAEERLGEEADLAIMGRWQFFHALFL
jgi:hypothetical protein